MDIIEYERDCHTNVKKWLHCLRAARRMPIVALKKIIFYHEQYAQLVIQNNQEPCSLSSYSGWQRPPEGILNCYTVWKANLSEIHPKVFCEERQFPQRSHCECL